jgi:hypothetical protein
MRNLFVCAVALVAIALAIGGAAAGPLPALTTAPTNLTCSLVGDNVECSWDALSGATKYSVDVVANYTTGSADRDFGTTDTSIIIPLSTFVVDVDGDLVADTPTSFILRVKGLNPPGKTDYHQKTPFSSTIICTVGGSCAPAI